MNKKLSVLIIGCGRVSAKHIKAINKHKDKLYLVGLVDTNESFAKKHSTTTLTKSTQAKYRFTPIIKRQFSRKSQISLQLLFHLDFTIRLQNFA